jgi:anaerobic magnesium-protoporphyrin IX monomethyl ester cyclase
MRVALVLCPSWSIEVPHLAMAMLSAYLRRDGHQVFTFDLNNDFYHNCIEDYKNKWRQGEDWSWVDPVYVSRFVAAHEHMIKEAVNKILTTDAQVIGFSVYHCTELISLELARRIKEGDKQRIIVFGGFQCLRELKGGVFIQDKSVDIVVLGEGDQTLSELVRMMGKDNKIDFCPGTILKMNGNIIDCGDRAPVIDLDSLPFPDFSDFPSFLYENSNALPFLFSRGCFQKCVYCTVNTFWKSYRSMSADRCFKEIKWQLENFNGVNHFFFYDALINGNIKELSRLCDLVIDAADKGIMPLIKWRAQAIIRAEMTAELLNKMKKAGCFSLSYGIESGSQRVLDKMKKYFKIPDAECVIRHTHEAGIEVALNFMFGFPSETEEDFQETLGFIRRNREYIDQIFPSESFCYIDKSTYLYEHCEEFGISSYPNSSFWESLDGRNNYPERLRRFETFCELVSSLNIEIGASYDKVKLFKQANLEKYYIYKKEKETNEQ